MSQELLYTSAPRGLKPGSRGFCTVLSTQGMSAPLAAAVEALSAYRPVFPTTDERASRNPVVHSHLKMQAAGRSWHVLSRIADYGLDYSQRPNKLAHHVILDNQAERLPGGPANLLSMPGFMRDEWQGEPALVAPKPITREPRLPSGVCEHWQEMTGDAGWAGVVAESFLRDPERLVILLFEPGQEILPLFAEALSLLPPEQRWEVTFSTYFTGLATGTTCQWRAMIHDSKEARESLRFVGALRIDLTQESLAIAHGGALAESARAPDRQPENTSTRPPLPVESSFKLESVKIDADRNPAAGDDHAPSVPPNLRRPPLPTSTHRSPLESCPPPVRNKHPDGDITFERKASYARPMFWLVAASIAPLLLASIYLWHSLVSANRGTRLSNDGASSSADEAPADTVAATQPKSPATVLAAAAESPKSDQGDRLAPQPTEAESAAAPSPEIKNNADNRAAGTEDLRTEVPDSVKPEPNPPQPNTTLLVERKELQKQKQNLLYKSGSTVRDTDIGVYAPKWLALQKTKTKKSPETGDVSFGLSRTHTADAPFCEFVLTYSHEEPVATQLALKCNGSADVDLLQWANVRIDSPDDSNTHSLQEAREFTFFALPILLQTTDRQFQKSRQTVTWNIGLPVTDLKDVELSINDVVMRVGKHSYVFSLQSTTRDNKQRFTSDELKAALGELRGTTEPELEFEPKLESQRLKLAVGMKKADSSITSCINAQRKRFTDIDRDFKRDYSAKPLFPLVDDKREVEAKVLNDNIAIIDGLIRDSENAPKQVDNDSKDGTKTNGAMTRTDRLKSMKADLQDIHASGERIWKLRRELLAGELISAKIECQLVKIGGKEERSLSIVDLRGGRTSSQMVKDAGDAKTLGDGRAR